MKSFLALGLIVVAGCGSGSSSDDSVSTFEPDPDVTISIPTEEELQEELQRTEEFALTVIGLAEQDAIEAIEADGMIARVIARDGEYFIVTEDFVYSRINLVIESGLVTEATAG
ncbi:MAG: hypothetical protein RLZZ254_1242 [Actinomycetota bacterium]